MDTIVTPASIQQLSRLEELLRRAGIGADEVQLLIDNPARRNYVVLAWLHGALPKVDMPDKFDKEAMESFVGYIFKKRIARLEQLATSPDYELVEGYAPLELATTEILKDLLEGLSPAHIQVAILRSGFIDGKEVKPAEVAKKLGITKERVNAMRTEVRRHIEAAQMSKYPFQTYVRKQPDISGVPIEKLDLNDRTLHCLILRGNISSIQELIKKSADDLLQIRNFGHRSLREVEAALEKRGLGLRLT